MTTTTVVTKDNTVVTVPVSTDDIPNTTVVKKEDNTSTVVNKVTKTSLTSELFRKYNFIISNDMIKYCIDEGYFVHISQYTHKVYRNLIRIYDVCILIDHIKNTPMEYLNILQKFEGSRSLVIPVTQYTNCKVSYCQYVKTEGVRYPVRNTVTLHGCTVIIKKTTATVIHGNSKFNKRTTGKYLRISNKDNSDILSLHR